MAAARLSAPEGEREAVSGRRARVVRQAVLCPARAEEAAQMRFAVEDALNTADFADCGRLVLVRRLRLDGVPPRASPAWMSRALEAAWREVAARAVPAWHEGADRAEAVFFASRFEARLSWLARVAEAGAVSAWFWSAALPELRDEAWHGRPAALAAVVAALLREGPAALAHALAAWPPARLAALARPLEPSVHARLEAVLAPPSASAGVAGGAPAGPAPGAAHDAAAPAAASAALLEVARRLHAHSLAGSPASRWVAAVWLTAPASGPAAAPKDVAAQVERAVALARAPAGLAAAAAASVERPAAARCDAPAQRGGAVTSGAAVAQEAPGTFGARPGTGSLPEPAPDRAAAPPPVAAARPAARRVSVPWLPWLADASASACGGLVLLLNLLRALRFDDWWRAQPPALAADVAEALLWRALEQVGAPRDDAQRDWFRDAPTAAAPTRAEARRWLARSRRALRRHAHMSLRELVCRPAWVSATPTHIDVIQGLDAADLRLRRLGLDVDPGWVPWIGRVVSLHFIDPALLPRDGEAGHG
ncbi:hypothetical protein [Azohydromonas aeria]|uniref:hypothetical protein n=1 Tax=Azohydromonas aeria TaxID=2590212 RepID=UPI0012F804E8|nr:hypothetical protein [Azohydromonas aeria]